MHTYIHMYYGRVVLCSRATALPKSHINGRVSANVLPQIKFQTGFHVSIPGLVTYYM